MLVSDFFHERKIFMKQVIHDVANSVFPNYFVSSQYKMFESISDNLHQHLERCISDVNVKTRVGGNSYIFYRTKLFSLAAEQFKMLNSIKSVDPQKYLALAEKYIKKYHTGVDSNYIKIDVTLTLNNTTFFVYVVPDSRNETFEVQINRPTINLTIRKEFPSLTPIDTIGEYIRTQLNKCISEIIVNSLNENL